MSAEAGTALLEGRLERGTGGLYEVRDDADGSMHTLRARGIFRKQGRTPMVGDRVRFTPSRGEEHGWLEDILPRTNEIKRPPVANLDQLFLVIAPEPTPDLLLLDRMLLWARQAAIACILVLNKADLDRPLLEGIAAQYKGADTHRILVSARTGEGLEELCALLSGKLSCFAGQSAVGKSSLLNALFGFALEVGGLSRRTERGRHTTRHVQLLRQGEAMVLDTPGFSLLDLWPELPPEELPALYPEYTPYAPYCRFQPCLHDTEPDCAVREAMAGGKISQERYERYRVLLAQVRESWRERYD